MSLVKIVDEIMSEADTASPTLGIRRIIISNPRNASNIYKKIAAVPVSLKDGAVLQFSFYTANKVFHYNLYGENIREKLLEAAGLGYKQWEIEGNTFNFKLLVNKKGEYKRINLKSPLQLAKNTEPNPHNRVKNHILKEGEAFDFLIHLGLMNEDGQVYKDKQKKLRQINKFLEIAGNVATYVDDGAHILDFGCGKSYLTFALYHYLNFILDKNVKISGLDLKEDVVAHCNELSERCGYDNLRFYCGDAAKFNEFGSVGNTGMMVTLHACDTATDYALAYAVQNNVKVILSVPCCQHELFGQIKNETLAPVLKYGILKERFSALLTDTVRGQLLEAAGYSVSIMEFVDMDFTAKNVMIRAIKTKSDFDFEKFKSCYEFCNEFSVEPMLYRILESLKR